MKLTKIGVKDVAQLIMCSTNIQEALVRISAFRRWRLEDENVRSIPGYIVNSKTVWTT